MGIVNQSAPALPSTTPVAAPAVAAPAVVAPVVQAPVIDNATKLAHAMGDKEVVVLDENNNPIGQPGNVESTAATSSAAGVEASGAVAVTAPAAASAGAVEAGNSTASTATGNTSEGSPAAGAPATNAQPAVELTSAQRIQAKIDQKKAQATKLADEIAKLEQTLRAATMLDQVQANSIIIAKVGRAGTLREVRAVVLGTQILPSGDRRTKISFGEGMDAELVIIQDSQIVDVLQA